MHTPLGDGKLIISKLSLPMMHEAKRILPETAKSRYPIGYLESFRCWKELDLHFIPSQRRDKIEVVTSVCTGHSSTPPGCCMELGSSPSQHKKSRHPHGYLDFLVRWKGLEPPTY